MDDTELTLADFFVSHDDNPFVAPDDFTAWVNRNEWAWSLYEPRMLGAVGPRVELERAGMRRQVVNLSSYNYLGLANHPEVVEAASQALHKYGTGGCGSPILSGMVDLHRELEQRLAALLGREDCMLFSSGFVGAMGTLAGILRKGDVAILDSKCHLCLIDGVKLSKARLLFFDHNDPKSLDEVLTKTEGRRRVVVVEGLYSMDGDLADLPALLPVLDQHGVQMMIDEAHSIGVYGDTGAGVVEHFGVADKVPLLFATMSKSFAAIGGLTSGSRDLLQYVRYFANSYGFSCALPPSVVGGLIKALEVAARGEQRRLLWENTNYFREQALGLGLDIGNSTSQVFPIIIGDNRRLLFEMATEMNDKGLFLVPVDYPSVPEDSLRYRVAITAAHSREDLDLALQILEDTVVRRLGARQVQGPG